MVWDIESRPTFSEDEILAIVRARYGLDGKVAPLPAERDQNFRFEVDGERFVIKIANRQEDRRSLEFQNAVLEYLEGSWKEHPSLTPRVVKAKDGSTLTTATHARGEYPLRIFTYLPGAPLSSLERRDPRMLRQLGGVLGSLDRCLGDFRHPGMERELPWDLGRAEWISAETGRIRCLERRTLVERHLLQHRAHVVPLLDSLPKSVIHNDANDENVLVSVAADGTGCMAGLLDFGDSLFAHTVNELAIACAYAILGDDNPIDSAADVVRGYHEARPLREEEVAALFSLIGMRLCVSVTMSAIAAENDPDNAHAQITDSAAGEMLRQLSEWDPQQATARFRSTCGMTVGGSTNPIRHLLGERRALMGPSLSLSYDTPLEMVRGRGQFLFDAEGRAYLDCVNNVPHVGHCHPRVVAALWEQAALLNTNTRYLDRTVIEYARRLTETLPEPLDTCFFVNSGSEANELAVRLARGHTQRHDVIVLEGGYHGNTSTLVDLSPYKCCGAGGAGLASWAHAVVKPDTYAGPHRGPDAGIVYADAVRETCDALLAGGAPPAFFLCESILGCGGQIVLPEGYLREAFRHVRDAGGVCIIDEVQVGFGRVGSHMWAFETQGVVPDIVTLGKPIGNGHPLGAVVTTREIAESFDNGMEFFSTFGGNPVSAAVGLAVLDVVRDEGLQEHALRVGTYLQAGFRRLGEEHEIIGDVRGLGLFMGVELVKNRDDRAPAPTETAEIIESAKADGVLLSAEGPGHNVLKIKPPLAFGEVDADLLLGAVERALCRLR